MKILAALCLVCALSSRATDLYLSKFKPGRSEFNSLEGRGELRNATRRAIRGVSVNVAFYDSSGALVEDGLDYISEIGPGETWKWKATCIRDSAVKVIIKSIETIGTEADWSFDPSEAPKPLPPKLAPAPFKDPAISQEEADRKRKESDERVRQADAAKALDASKAITEAKVNAYSAQFRGVKLRAESGSVEAMKELAGMYRAGKGTRTNEVEAARWEAKAMEAKP